MKLFKFFRKSSGNIAKERLSSVLISDRACCAPNILESIKCDMTHTLSKYMEVNTEKIDFKVITSGGNEMPKLPVLVVRVPFKRLNKADSEQKASPDL